MAKWTEEHKGLWEFIKFNILSNVSTIFRFIMTWIGTAIFIDALGMTSPFSFLIFDYTSASSNGIGGFITFLIAEAVAQIVNFFVQMKWVFKSTASFKTAAPKYAVLAVVIVVVNLILPGHVSAFCQGTLGMNAQLAGTIASVVNTVLAVVVSFPILKFWITPSVEGDEGKNSGAGKSADEGAGEVKAEVEESKASDEAKAPEEGPDEAKAPEEGEADATKQATSADAVR